MKNNSFSDLGLLEPIERALKDAKYTEPTPIQLQAIPPLLEGRDLLGCAQTGTGKTAAFALPILHTLTREGLLPKKKSPRALILAPTRELAMQIYESFQCYGKHLRLSLTCVYGGVGYRPQIRALAKGVDVLIATPGRLLDLKKQGYLTLSNTNMLVLDEADRMLDMGFIRDVEKIVADLPRKRQTIFFSATLPPSVGKLAEKILTEPVSVSVNPESSTAELIDDRVLFVGRGDKPQLLFDVLQQEEVHQAMVFTRTKHRANKLSTLLSKRKIRAEAIHGNKSQNARQRALGEFKEGKVRVLVATDLVARGIDVSGLSHVINYELPDDPESYVHRIGRTARAGSSGMALSFCDLEEAEQLVSIEKLIKRKVTVEEEHALHNEEAAASYLQELQGQRGRKRNSGRRPMPRKRSRNRPRRRTNA